MRKTRKVVGSREEKRVPYIGICRVWALICYARYHLELFVITIWIGLDGWGYFSDIVKLYGGQED